MKALLREAVPDKPKKCRRRVRKALEKLRRAEDAPTRGWLKARCEACGRCWRP